MIFAQIVRAMLAEVVAALGDIVLEDAIATFGYVPYDGAFFGATGLFGARDAGWSGGLWKRKAQAIDQLISGSYPDFSNKRRNESARDSLTVWQEKKHMIKADKYSGLVIALAVLIAVFYVEGEYNKWDIFLGMVGFTLGMKYAASVDGMDLFFTFLTSSLISIGFVAVIFGIVQLSTDMQDAVSEKPFASSFIVFISLTLLLTSFMHILKRKEPEKEVEPTWNKLNN